MRRNDGTTLLTPAQATVAQQGLKAMIPFKRPFLDYSLSNIADAGFRRICLVIGADHARVRDYYARIECRRLSIECAVQLSQMGTAHALSVAEQLSGNDGVLALNGDNCYPTTALCALRPPTRVFQSEDVPSTICRQGFAVGRTNVEERRRHQHRLFRHRISMAIITNCPS
jgi:UTP-glucose-1-phosphate uridylyltransferase